MKASVGSGGRNLSEDVREIQKLLNRRAILLGIARLVPSGRCTGPTIRAIRRFEMLALRMKYSDGRVEPGSRTYAALITNAASAIGRQRADTLAALSAISGPAWWANHRETCEDSSALHELQPGFAGQLRDMVGALRRGGATVVVRTTRHDDVLAFAGHWAWQVANGTTLPRNVPDHPDVALIWDHGEPLESRLAARDMLTAREIDALPPLESALIDGTAVEMTIDWSGMIRIVDAHGKPHWLDRPRDAESNPVLHAIGRSFGVVKDRAHRDRWLARDTASDVEHHLIAA